MRLPPGVLVEGVEEVGEMDQGKVLGVRQTREVCELVEQNI